MNSLVRGILGFLALTICAESVGYPRQDAKAAFAKSQAAVLTVQTEKALGTGFAVGDGSLVLTCYHVVGSDTEHIKVGSKNLQAAELVSSSPEFDIAVLRVRKPYSAHLKLIQGQTPPTGTKIYVIGSPLGLEKTLSEGIVSGLRRSGDLAYIQVTAPISHGSSGSPIISAAGEVVAMASMSLEKGQSLNFGISAYNLQRVLSGQRDTYRNNADNTKIKTDAQYDVPLPLRYKLPSGHLNFKQVIRDVNSEDSSEKNLALQTLPKLGARAIPDIFKYLEEESTGFPERDDFAASTLQIYGKNSMPFLVQAMKSGPKLSRLISVQTIKALWYLQTHPEARHGDPSPGNGNDPWLFDSKLKSALLDAADDENAIVKIEAIKACTDFGYKAVARSAEKVLKDPKQEEFIRLWALEALTQLEAVDAETLTYEAHDLLANVKQLTLGFYSIRTETAYRVLRYILGTHEDVSEGEFDPVASQAIEFLSRYQKTELIDVFKKYVSNPNDSVRFSAAEGIGRSGGQAGIAPLKILLSSNDRQTRRGALYGVAYSGSIEAFDMLSREVLRNDEFSDTALKAMGELNDDKTEAFVKKYLESDSTVMKGAAKEAMNTILKRRKKGRTD